MTNLSGIFVQIDWTSVIVVILNIVALVGIGCLLYYLFGRTKRNK